MELYFLFVKDVLDLWYIGYFMFLVVERFWKRQEDEVAQRRRSETTADRFSREQWHNWNRSTKRESWEGGETPGCRRCYKRLWRNPPHKNEGHYYHSVSSRESVYSVSWKLKVYKAGKQAQNSQEYYHI